VFEADPAGDAAAGNGHVARVQPLPVPTSDPDVDDGTPVVNPTAQAAGRVGVVPAPAKAQFNSE
jgi:hypothetical protein